MKKTLIIVLVVFVCWLYFYYHYNTVVPGKDTDILGTENNTGIIEEEISQKIFDELGTVNATTPGSVEEEISSELFKNVSVEPTNSAAIQESESSLLFEKNNQ